MPGDRSRRYGFHQLTDTWAARLVAGAAVPRSSLVLDIGAGTGALTRHLVASGARVVAVELHPGRAAALRRAFADAVTVVQTDATDLRLPRQPFRVAANPPFASSTAILRRLVAPGSRLVAADVVLPLYVARRWAEGNAPGAGRWRLVFDATVVRVVPPRAFVPVATGPCAVLRIARAR